MGVMVDGRWTTDEEASQLSFKDGDFQRNPSVVRNWVTRDGSPGPSGQGGFAAERGRYHLYVSYNCPWAHRTLIFRVLKRLEDVVSVSVVRSRRTDQGWVFDPEPGPHHDDVLGKHALWEVYADGHPSYSGRVTVPVLYDKKTGRLVSNESAEIIRMLNSAFTDCGADAYDYYPPELRGEIDALNERVYETVNNGVYRAGFARTQEAYAKACRGVFETLDWLDERLAGSRYLCGDRQTEADWRLFTTLARFDVAYHYAFKCNLRRLMDYESLWPYARELYQTPGIAETVHFEAYKQGYFSLSELRNPLGIVPLGPIVNFSEPPGREASSGAARGRAAAPG